MTHASVSQDRIAHRATIRRRASRATLAMMLPLLLAGTAMADEPAAEAVAERAVAAVEKKARTTHYYLGFFTAGSWASADASGSLAAPSGTSTDHSFFWGANLGAQMPIGRILELRLEFEGTNERRYSLATPGGAAGDRANVKAWTFNGNFWIVYPLKRHLPDVPVLNRVSAFGGGGVGLSRITFDVFDSGFAGREKQVKFAWQGGVGVSFDVARWLVLDLRYQYADLGRASAAVLDGGGVPQGDLRFDLGANELVGGLRFVY